MFHERARQTIAAITIAAVSIGLSSTQSFAQITVDIDDNDIGGNVTSSNGPEAGVWVIAETEDLETRFARIVVTDDSGQYLIPDLPDANYSVWVRGYGLTDSAKVDATPGSTLDLDAVATTDPALAAQVYPAAYWYSMMKIPEADQLAHLDNDRNMYLGWMKNLGCVGCHQLGQLSTRTIPVGPRCSSARRYAGRRSRPSC